VSYPPDIKEIYEHALGFALHLHRLFRSRRIRTFRVRFMHSSSNACLISARVSVARFSQIFRKFDTVSLTDPFQNRTRPDTRLQINWRKNQQVYPAARNCVHWLLRYASTIIYYSTTLLQLLYIWQHMSRKLWISRLLRLYFLPDFHEWMSLVLVIVQMLYRFPIHLNFSETHFTYGLYTEPKGFSTLFRRLLGINKRVNDTLKITVKMKIISQATNCIKYIWF
jgi:hypothetical protein